MDLLLPITQAFWSSITQVALPNVCFKYHVFFSDCILDNLVYYINGFRSIACYVVPLIPALTYSVYFSGILAQFLIEKMGMMGSLPPPHG